MAMKLFTTLVHMKSIPNPTNASLVKEFYEYLKEIGTSENYQNQMDLDLKLETLYYIVFEILL